MEASNRVFRYGHSSEVRVSVTSSAFVSGWTMKATSVTAVPKADDGPTCSVAVQAGLVSSSPYSCTQKAQAISRVEMARFAFASPSGLCFYSLIGSCVSFSIYLFTPCFIAVMDTVRGALCNPEITQRCRVPLLCFFSFVLFFVSFYHLNRSVSVLSRRPLIGFSGKFRSLRIQPVFLC